MCNQGIGRLEQSFSQQSDETLDQQQQQQQHRREEMVDSSSSPSLSLSPSPCTDDTPRVKFLCSFGGSILPRPQDGKLRYVGGETRIMSLLREISYEELMVKMRELFDGATLLKYQQPDEDLDALVSVVNDDDVTNMMEEYDKLGSGDGFTRLRIFLFSHPDQDGGGGGGSSHFDAADERETERRYVDALNSLNDSPEFRKQQLDSPVLGPIDNVHVGAEQFFNPISLDAGFQNQRNCDIPLPQFNLHHLRIPRVGSAQHQQAAHIQRYNEMEAPWSPAYYSPRHHGHHDPRTMMEFPTSPSSSRYRMNMGDPVDKVPDRMPEEYLRQQMNHQSQYEQQTPPFVDNVVRLPPPGPIPGDKGFPGNIGHVHNVFEGSSSSSINEQRRMMAFHRNQNLPEAACHPDSRWKHGGQSHLEQPSMGNEFHHVVNSCSDCNPTRESYLMNTEQNGTRSFYNEAHNHERGRVLNHQLNYLGEEPRTHVSGVGRVNEHYMLDGAGVNYPLAHGNCSDGHQVFSNCINHETPRYIRPGSELGNEGLHDQIVGSGPHVHVSPLEDPGLRYGNFPSAPYGTDNPYQVSHGPAAPAHAVWRKMQNPLQRPPSYEPSAMLPQGNGSINSGFLRSTREGSPSFRMDNASAWNGPPQQVFGFDSTVQYHHGYAPRFNSNTMGQENPNPFYPDQAGTSPETIDFAVMKPVLQGFSSSSAFDDKVLASTIPVNNPEYTDGTNATGALRMEEKNMPGESSNEKPMETVEESDIPNNSSPVKTEADGKTKEEADGKMKEEANGKMKEEALDSNVLDPAEEVGPAVKLGDTDGPATVEQERVSVKNSSVLPEVMASVKNMALEVAEEVKDKAEGNVDGDVGPTSKEAASDDAGSVNTHTDVEVETDNDHPNVSKIEPTKAEAEALARGLQMIKNDDLEEIRELGSGTYGAVYHGKWKGSDVAIKRIKASCFSGRPSERERLIADFWKEALILSSLHHPNVVSFYGIVRDGPDGSLATVTEFMVNGSMKQFLQKKDRTMDRRKRLIIAMDVAFGMEYLHGKNVVHFDLKCENLLVNMRDHNRPVCKIGDLGLSKVKQHTLVSGGVRGTLPWMAPELLSGKSNMVTEKIDVYSFGIVLWELLTGEEPYADMHCASLIGGIVNNNLRPETPTWCDPEWKSLMESCWASEPGERPSFSEISQKLRKMAAAINLK